MPTRRVRKTRKQKAGNPPPSVRVDIRQILITEPIKQGVISLTGNSAINLSKFKKAPGHQGFPLPRLEAIRNKNIRANLERYPIELEVLRNKDGNPLGTAINGVRKPLYKIVNGRHRFAKAVAEGLTVIPAIILS